MTREYTPEVKAQVMAALLAGQSATTLSKEFGIPRGTITGWQSYKRDPILASAANDASDASLKKLDDINGLVLDLMIAQLKSQIALAEHAGDKKWLTAQDASAVGVLLGIENDKVFRLLEALNRARTESEAAKT